MNQPLQIRPGQMYRGSKPVRDPDYKRFIKRLPCVACLKSYWVDPAHTGSHGLGQKASDVDCIPLCRTCHRQYDSNPQQFARVNQLDIPALIRRFNEFYNKLKGQAA